eukprot:GHVU01015294.1.p1 GENE.GHVU01015294.1~~GHVU01015294.1.p1  ORF type:complete len:161 (-),score=12.21 GHVU01015294.1:9-491(-)
MVSLRRCHYFAIPEHIKITVVSPDDPTNIAREDVTWINITPEFHMKITERNLHKKFWRDTIKDHLDGELMSDEKFSSCLGPEYKQTEDTFRTSYETSRHWADSGLSLYARTKDEQRGTRWHLLSSTDLSSIEMDPEDYMAKTTEFLVTGSKGTWLGDASA